MDEGATRGKRLRRLYGRLDGFFRKRKLAFFHAHAISLNSADSIGVDSIIHRGTNDS
jgi:hypothetical protein